MGDSGRIIAIFGSVAVAAAAGGYWFFAIHRPHQVLVDAQDEVQAWEARWAKARECLLGPTPMSAKTSEALSIRELEADALDPTKCTSFVGKLVRGDAPDTGLPAVEDAWVALDKAATRAAGAFGLHLGANALASDGLPAALDALDKARAELRIAAKLPAEATGTPAAVLAPAALIPIADGDRPVTKLKLYNVTPSFRGAVISGSTEDHLVQVVLVPGADPKVLRVGPNEQRSATDPSYAFAASGPDLGAGAANAEGVIAKPLSLHGGFTFLTAAVGNADEALAVVQTVPLDKADAPDLSKPRAGVVRAKGGKLELTSVGDLVDQQLSAVAPDGRALVTWTTRPKTEDAPVRARAQWFGLATSDPYLDTKKLIELGAQAPDSACLSSVLGRVHVGDHLVTVGSDGGTRLDPIAGSIAACGVGAALMRAPTGYAICDEGCRDVKLPGAPAHLAVGLGADNKPVGAITRGTVLAVWREGAVGPAFYGLPEPAVPDSEDSSGYLGMFPLTSDGKVLDLLVRTAKGRAIVRVPAK